MSTYARVKEIIVSELGVEDEEIEATTTFDELDLDELDMVELVMAVEEEFGLEIHDEDAEGVETVGELVALVDRLLGD